MLKILINRKNN